MCPKTDSPGFPRNRKRGGGMREAFRYPPPPKGCRACSGFLFRFCRKRSLDRPSRLPPTRSIKILRGLQKSYFFMFFCMLEFS